jgi:integrase
MPRHVTKRLTAATVKHAKPGKYFDGDNLKLLVKSERAKSWSFVYTPHGGDGKKREMGLGSIRQGVTLAKARQAARDALDLHLTGVDPLSVKQSRRAAHANAITAPTFLKAAADYIEAQRSGWADGEAEQWEQQFRDYAFPILGAMPVADIAVAHVKAVLQPIWVDKYETARRVRSRIEKVLGCCKTLNQRTGDNPAAWKENLENLLPKRSKAQRVKKKNHAAMPYRDLGDFMIELRAVDGVIARALEFTIRCAARAGETRLATWAEIDQAKREWVVPAERMKKGVEHRVPLDDRSIAILQEMFQTRRGDFIFQVDGAELGEDDMLRLLQRGLKRPGATVHGMRATFKTWVQEKASSYPNDVSEMALAHGNKDATEAAYARAEFREQRRQLAEAWGAFCSAPSIRPTGTLLDFSRRAG